MSRQPSAAGGVTTPAAARRGWLVLSLLFVLSLPAVTPRLYASDEIEYFAYLRSLWFDGDLSFDNEYRYFYDRGIATAHGFHETFLELATETGRRLNFGTIGAAILWAPFYAIGDVTARAMHAAGAPVAVDGFSRPYLAAVAYGSAVYGFLAVILSIVAAQRLVGAGMLAASIVWFGTPLLFYMYVAPGMAHAGSAFAVALFVVTWLRVRERWSLGGVATLGALAALVGMVREQDLLIVVGPVIDFLRTCVLRVTGLRSGDATGAPGWRTLAVRAAAGCGLFVLCYTPQLAAYLVLNGRLGPSQLVTRKMTWTAPHALEVLFSPAHGFFFWTPLAMLAVVGLIVMAAFPHAGSARTLKNALNAEFRTQNAEKTPLHAPDTAWLAWCFLAMLLGQVYVAGSVESWTVAGAFGQRRFVAVSVLLSVGLAALWRAARPHWTRVPLAVGLALGVWWNLGLMAQFGAGTMDRQRLEPARNAYNTFVVVPPELPGLAYRYLFNRESFYRPADR